MPAAARERCEIAEKLMARAIELAGRGEGLVEPNPLVGCVIAQGTEIVGEGWHGRFGGPHAEIEALEQAGPAARGATLYVTLEPCCHHGKTPPCAPAIIAAGVRQVVVAQQDPFPRVAGEGLRQLREAGLDVELGVLEPEARQLNAPYHKLLGSGRPWVIGKWAMTLDGKIATRSGDSRWISNEHSRECVHRLRGRMDAILVGRGTVLADDPLLTARPPGPRLAIRVVLDSQAVIPLESQLVQTASRIPLLVVTGPQAPPERHRRLQAAHCQTLACSAESYAQRFDQTLEEFGRRQFTNVLIEGGSGVLGAALDAGQLDELHVFVGPWLVGGRDAPGPVAGQGIEKLAHALQLANCRCQQLGNDAYLHGRLTTNT